ncbi:hypothetical protein KFK09_003241 [Dendrobium nobile]|uniref:Uncharacterized protein n=1 Tax=Dendrobium nobile TaxID=94219 RepID=A0A8T3C9K7_DENNO|nr:hypothetical protein KFK09_003241 [Dendrobium nobile]
MFPNPSPFRCRVAVPRPTLSLSLILLSLPLRIRLLSPPSSSQFANFPSHLFIYFLSRPLAYLLHILFVYPEAEPSTLDRTTHGRPRRLRRLRRPLHAPI